MRRFRLRGQAGRGDSYGGSVDAQKRAAVWVACALCFGEHRTRAYMHVCRLALHIEHPLHDPRVGLFVSEPDRPGKNRLPLQRMILQGEAVPLNVGATDYAHVKERDLARVPPSAMMRGVADFSLWELRLQDAHLVFGFGLAYRTDATAPLSWLHQKPSTKSVKGET